MFAYGVVVGKEKIFPFQLMRCVKQILIPPELKSNDSEYEVKTSLYKLYLPNPHPKIVMIGDSITNGCDWNELLKRDDVINRGIYGDTTYGVVHRLDTINTGAIDKAFILIGINDLSEYTSVEDVLQRYQHIIHYLQIHHITPIIQSTLYVNSPKRDYEAINLQVSTLNDQLKALAQKHHIVYIDLNARLSKDHRLLHAYTKGDGLHLNSKGYALWREALTPYL